MRRIIIIILVALWLIGGSVAAQAQEPAKGEITGQVVNGTEGGGSVAGVVITLITYVDDMMSDTATTTTGGEGKFRFDAVSVEHEYLVSAEYMGVDYYYPVSFESGEETAYVEVGVCDVTDSDQAISISLTHTVINVTEDGLEITVVYWLINNGDKTYMGTDGALFFTLPEGVFGFEAPQELMMDYQLLEGNMIAYLVPFPPGERQLFYTYRLAKPGTAEFTLPLKVDYPTDSLELMIAGEDIEAAVAQLAPAKPVITDTGQRFIHFQGKNLPRNTMIDLHLTNLSRGRDFPIVILWIIIVIVVASTTVYLIRRKRRMGVGG